MTRTGITAAMTSDKDLTEDRFEDRFRQFGWPKLRARLFHLLFLVRRPMTLGARGDSSSINSFESMMLMESMMMSRQLVVDGKFSIQSVKPGEYTIAARGAARSGAGAPNAGRGGPQQPMNLWASADVSVSGADVSGVVLRLIPGVDIRGRVTLEGDTTAKPVDFSAVTVRLQSAPGPGVLHRLELRRTHRAS